MRRPLIVIFLLALLCACGNREKYARLLAEADSLNQNYIPFTTDSTMKEVVDYYDHHGTANERMRAYYLLGCVYRDLGEAPHALECYHDAVDCADTTARDCDFRLLGRIHGQMATLFGTQLLPRDMLRELKATYHYASLANDTMCAIIAIERQAVAYELLQQPDSGIIAVERAISLYNKYGLYQDEAIACQHLIVPYITKGDYQRAKKYIDLYERKSGRLDEDGNPQDRTNLFLYEKGLYYLAINEFDSAEVHFRKQLKVDEDLNCQEAANRGLALLYQKKHIPDSAAKYADISYQINDKRDMQVSSEESRHVEALYNYSRNQQVAYQEHDRRTTFQLWLTIIVGLTLTITVIGIVYICHLHRKRRQEHQIYEANIDKLAKAQSELQKLKDMQMKELIETKTREIELLELEINVYQQVHSDNVTQPLLEKRLASSVIYKRFCETGNGKGNVSATDWEQLSELMDEIIPKFRSVLNSIASHLRVNEDRICMLVRLHFTPAEIGNILSMNPSAVTMIRRRLHRKIFGTEGTAKEFDQKIQLMGINFSTDEMDNFCNVL